MRKGELRITQPIVSQDEALRGYAEARKAAKGEVRGNLENLATQATPHGEIAPTLNVMYENAVSQLIRQQVSGSEVVEG